VRTDFGLRDRGEGGIDLAEGRLDGLDPLVRFKVGCGEMMQRCSRFLREVPTELLEEWQNGGASW
jgi:hypothetical protein